MYRDLNDPNHLQFIHYRQTNQSYSMRYKSQSSNKSSFLDLSEQFSTILKYAPRLFTITTNSNSYHFNIELLKDSSLVIDQNLKDNPNNLQFHIDINDKKNVMQKFEKLFMGEKVVFAENELSVSRKITSALKIIRCPNYMKPESLHTGSNYGYSSGSSIENGVIINKTNLPIFFQNGLSKSFTIITNLKNYNCTSIGVMSSKIIRDLVEKDHSINTFEYDFDDDFNEFEDICNFFNFQAVQITTSNMTHIQKIAEDLQIDYVLEEIKKFIEKYQNAIQTINDKQFLIDTIDELFECLYHIKELTIEKVKESIVESFWSESEEDVQELAAFIIQVIGTDIQYHQDIFDLLIQLDKSANETNSLHLLLPFITNHLLLAFVKNNLYCSFVYILYKNGRIEMKEIIDVIISNNKSLLKKSDDFVSGKRNKKVDVSQAILWFFPELYQSEIISRRKLFQNLNSDFHSFIFFYYPKNIDKYKKMRDSGEPDDEITRALRRDDVDTLQSIVSKRETDFSNEKVPFNIFENFIDNGNTNYLNYSAAYGSTKCFKYLLLNHAEMNDITFCYAVYGGNNEIIRIAFQSSENKPEGNATTKYPRKVSKIRSISAISAAIMKHQNNLFDWILEHKYTSKGITGNDLSEIVYSSINSGNAHSIIECIDKGLDMNSLSIAFNASAIVSSCKNGFYRLTQLLFIFIKKSNLSIVAPRMSSDFCENAAIFGNLSLFKYVVEYLNPDKKRIEESILVSISRNHFQIIKYIVENLGVQFSNELIGEFLYVSINKRKVEIFKYLISHFNIIPSQNVLMISCQLGNFEIVKIVVDLIIKANEKYDFTDAFIQSALIGSEEICRYFVEKKANLNFDIIEKKIFRIVSKNEDIVFLLIEIADPEIKTVFMNSCLNKAIRHGKMKLVEYLINNNVNIDEALFKAAAYGNIEIVDMILKRNSQPFYINSISELGTALNIAVRSNSYSVVKRLLSIPGIDPSLYEQRNETPLISAIVDYNIKMINAILDFYGDGIQSQLWQINKALEIVLGNFFGKCIRDRDQFKSLLLHEILNMNKNEINGIDNQYMDGFVDNEQYPYIVYDDDDDDDNEDDDEDDERILGSEIAGVDEEEEEEKNEAGNSDNNNTKNHDKVKDKENTILNVMSRILQIKNININCHVDKYTLLHYACEMNEKSLVKMLLDYEGCDVNSYAPFDGSTPLMVAIQNNNIEIAELLLNLPKINVNCNNYTKETALTIAVDRKSDKIIDLIVKNVNFNPYESRLNFAFYMSSGQIASQLLSVNDLDVNYMAIRYVEKNTRGRRRQIEKFCLNETTLTRAVSQKDIEKIEMITSHPSFDKVKSQLKTAIFLSAKMNEVEIFKKLIVLIDNDVNCRGKANDTLLHLAVFNQSEEIVSEILKNDHFDSSKSDIIESFILSFTECKKSDQNDENQTASISIMSRIFTFDGENDHLIDLNRCLKNGKSFLTSISDKFSNIDEIVDFLIEKGADPNRPDTFGIFPLQFGLENANSGLVRSLINSEKVDYSTRIGELGMTYLHVAAHSKSLNNLNVVLSQNMIDVNSIDKNGDTPLIYAVRAQRDKNVIDLFKNENLDYAHKNNDGDDALNIAKKNLSQKGRVMKPRHPLARNIDGENRNQDEEKSRYLDQLLMALR